MHATVVLYHGMLLNILHCKFLFFDTSLRFINCVDGECLNCKKFCDFLKGFPTPHLQKKHHDCAKN